ncbi:MAG: hypothetical protein L0H59_12855 [Tomitella sp.]|nr:hypothetical protein [Tomitella sp.]
MLAWLAGSKQSPLRRFTPRDADVDSVFDVKVIYQQACTEVDITTVPEIFLPRVGPFQVIDYEKIYAADPDEDIFAQREIDRAGCVVVVRPDQYVAHVLPLTARDELTEFFAQNMLAQD